jgi:flagellar basal body-associated protein FliL
MSQTPGSFVELDAANQAKKTKLFSIRITGAIVAAIIIGECATVYIFLAFAFPIGKAAARRAAADEHVHTREVDLGKFSLTALDPNSSGSLLIEFHLIGSVVAAHSAKATEGDAIRDGSGGNGSISNDVAENTETAFETLFQPETSRFRDQVIAIIGNAEISVMGDPGLEPIKRQILARTNSLLGEPLLEEIRFSDFAVVQQ